MSGQSATIAALAAFASNSQDLAWGERKPYLSYAEPQTLEAKLTSLFSPMPASGTMVVNSGNFDITTDNGKVFSEATTSFNSTNADVQGVANKYQLARLQQAVADLLLKDDNTAYAAPSSIDEARVALAANLAPLGANINDYLVQYTSIPSQMSLEIQNGAGDALESKNTTSDILPSVIGSYTEGTSAGSGTKAKFVVQGDLTAAPYALGNSDAVNFLASSAATAFGTGSTIAYSSTTGLTTIEAGAVGSKSAGLSADEAAHLELSFNASDSSTTVAITTASGADKYYSVAGYYIKNTTTISTVEQFGLVHDVSKSGKNQPAVDWAASSNNVGAYMATNGPTAAAYRLEDLRINTTLSSVKDTLSKIASGNTSSTFDSVSTDVNEINAIRAAILPTPTISAVITAGPTISETNIVKLSDFVDYFVGLGLTTANYNKWAGVVLANATAPDGYVYSPQLQYRASNSQSDLSFSGAKVLAMESLLGSKGPSTLTAAITLLGSGSVQVYQVDTNTGNFSPSTTQMAAATLYMRAETSFTPGTVLGQGQLSQTGIVAYFNDSGTVPTLNPTSALSSITLAFNNMSDADRFAAALNALESYNNGSQSIVEEVAAYALANNAVNGTTSRDLALLASYVMGGTSAQISATKFLGTNATGAQFLVAAAINVLIGAKEGFAALGSETVVKALKRAELLRQVQNVDAFDTTAGIFTGVAALGADNVMTFTPPSKTFTGANWTGGSALTANKLPAVKEVYDALTTYSGFTFNDAEKAHLFFELIKDFIGPTGGSSGTPISAADWMSMENYVSKDVWMQYVAKYVFTAGNTFMGVNPPVQADALRTQMNDTTKTDAQRKAAWDALFVLLFDLAELVSSSSTVSSSATLSPGVASGSEMVPVFETILDVGTFANSASILVFLKAFFDLDIIADMELNALSIPVSISSAIWSGAVGDLFAYAAGAVAQYSASPNAISNINEISLSASNALRLDGATLRPALNNPETELNTVITQIGSSFNGQMVLMEAIADPSTRTIGPSLKRELELAGFPQGIVEAYIFVVAELLGRQITGESKYLMYDASAA